MQEMYDACCWGDVEALKEILKTEEKSPDFFNTLLIHFKKRTSPLVVAIKKENPDIVEVLLSDPRIDIYQGKFINYYGGYARKLAPRYAFECGNPKIECLFLEHKDMDLTKVVYDYSSKPCNSARKEYVLPKVISIVMKKIKLAKILIKQDIDFVHHIPSISKCKSRVRKLVKMLRNGWSVETHDHFPPKCRSYAWSLFLYDLRVKYVPNDIKREIMSYIPVFDKEVVMPKEYLNKAKKNKEDKDEDLDLDSEGSDSSDSSWKDDIDYFSEQEYNSSDDEP